MKKTLLLLAAMALTGCDGGGGGSSATIEMDDVVCTAVTGGFNCRAGVRGHVENPAGVGYDYSVTVTAPAFTLSAAETGGDTYDVIVAGTAQTCVAGPVSVDVSVYYYSGDMQEDEGTATAGRTVDVACL